MIKLCSKNHIFKLCFMSISIINCLCTFNSSYFFKGISVFLFTNVGGKKGDFQGKKEGFSNNINKNRGSMVNQERGNRQ